MKKIVIASLLVIGLGSILFAYSQIFKRSTISAILQNQINVNAPPGFVYAISTADQSLVDGKVIPKGTRFIGMLSKEENNFTIYFNEIETFEGRKETFSAKTNLMLQQASSIGGVSAKIGKTLYQQSKTNVLGAIFSNASSDTEISPNAVLPRGSILKIEIN